MQSSSRKLYEVDRITGRRQNKGNIEFLVDWKGYGSYSATWEPIENLSFCKKIVDSFTSRISPIPGGIPCNVSEVIPKKKTFGRGRTISVKMLLTKKRRSKSVSGSRSSSNGDNVQLKPPQKRLSETEKLIRATLLHESKTMKSSNTSLAMVNGLIGFDKEDRNHRVNGYVKDFNGNTRKRKSNSAVDESSDMEKTYGSMIRRTSAVNNWSGKNTLRDAQEGDHVICRKQNNCMKITLNNTARHNVLTVNMMDTIDHCLQTAQKDKETRAVLIRNNGDHFCSGFDYSELIECDEREYKKKCTEFCNSIRSLTETLLYFPKPIMTAVNGICIGFGISLLALGDLSFASSRTNFGLTNSKLDLTPVGCLTYLLPKIVGPTMANSMFFLGENYRATAAYDRGLINDIYGINSFEEDIEKRINQLVSCQSQALENTKSLLREPELEKLQSACDQELKAYSKCIATDKCRRKLAEDWTAAINLYGSV